MMSLRGEANVEEARSLDRALRSCKGISDIDTVWARWSFIGDSLGWITVDELRFHPKKGYRYVRTGVIAGGRLVSFEKVANLNPGDAWRAWFRDRCRHTLKIVLDPSPKAD